MERDLDFGRRIEVGLVGLVGLGWAEANGRRHF